MTAAICRCTHVERDVEGETATLATLAIDGQRDRAPGRRELVGEITIRARSIGACLGLVEGSQWSIELVPVIR